MKKVFLIIAAAAVLVSLSACGVMGAERTVHLNLVTASGLSYSMGIPLSETRKIINYRLSIRQFTSIDQLYDVPGLDPKIANQLRESADIDL